VLAGSALLYASGFIVVYTFLDFVSAIAAGRGRRASTGILKSNFGEGRIFTADEAMGHGLADKIQPPREFYKAIQSAAEESTLNAPDAGIRASLGRVGPASRELERARIHVSEAHRVVLCHAATIAADIVALWAVLETDGRFWTNPKTGEPKEHPAAKSLDALRRDHLKALTMLGLRASVAEAEESKGETLEDILNG
jgi:ClpP class serine protease